LAFTATQNACLYNVIFCFRHSTRSLSVSSAIAFNQYRSVAKIHYCNTKRRGRLTRQSPDSDKFLQRL